MELKYGRRAPKLAKALAFADIRSGVIPQHPLSQDNLAAFTDWSMLLNDRIGDCVVATWSNIRRIMTALAGHENYVVDDATLIGLYKTQNPKFDLNGTADTNGPGSSADGGMDIQTLLEYLHEHGGPDGVKAVAFAKVDHTNIEEVKAAISIFGYVWTGIAVQAANMDDFDENRPWDYHQHSADDGSHSVVTGGYDADDERFLTWARETQFTQSFWDHQTEEAWVVVWPENLKTQQFQEGVNAAALAAAYTQVTNGKKLPSFPQPSPTPAPTPTPEPTPEPVPEPAADAADLKLAAPAYEWLQLPHSGVNRIMAHHLYDWLQEKKLM